VKRASLHRCLTLIAAIAIEGGAVASEPQPQTLRIDASNARVEFDIAALWVLHRRGHFDELHGNLTISADGQNAEIDVRIRVDSVQMKDRNHVDLLLSPAFFDAVHHPWIEFRSDVFALSGDALLALPGTLSVRGISRRVRFDVDLGNCRPGLPESCTVVVDGVLQRSRFGMTEYRRTLADKVYLQIAARLGGLPATLSESGQARSADRCRIRDRGSSR
jgi:polyisoprenoid-binding protein YceI